MANTSFTPGNIVVYRVGDGSTALSSSSAPVFLDEYTPTGTLVQSIELPTADAGSNHALTESGTATSEGELTLSANGQYLLLTGYDAAPATKSINSTNPTTTARVVGRVDPQGNIDTTTALTDAESSGIRGVASPDGSTIYVSGNGTSASGGVRVTTLGSTTSTQLSTTVTNTRGLEIYGGQLYVSDMSGSSVRLGAVGTGLPTTSGQTITALPGLPTDNTSSPYAFYLADLSSSVAGDDTLYVADDTAGGGEILKYSLVGGTWVSNGAIADAAVRGLTGSTNGSSVTLFTTTGGSGATGGGALDTFTDTSGYDATMSGTVTQLATAGTNEAFRGVAFAPVAPDTTPPTLLSATPSESATNVAVGANIVLTFSEAVKAGSGSFTITDDNGDTRTIAVGDTSQVTISGSTVTINPTADLNPSDTYHVTAPAGIVTDTAGNAYAGLPANTVDFTTAAAVDNTPPTLTMGSPAEGATNVAVGSNIVLTFSETVVAGSGSFTITDSNGDTRTIAVGDTTQVTISGNTVTINPTADLKAGDTYHVTAPAGIVTDTSGNAYAGISANTVDFTTAADTTPPTLVSATPAESATGVAVGANIVLTFSEAVLAGSGNFTITDSNGDTRTIAIGDTTQVTISGNTVTINPTADLKAGDTYHVTAPAGIVTDTSGNAYAGIPANTVDFTTAADTTPPTLVSATPTESATGVAVGANVVLTFSEPVLAGSGNFTLTDNNGDTRTIAVGDTTQVTVSGSTVTINPTADLKAGDTYHVTAPAGIVTDTSGNAYTGLPANTVDFTTQPAAASGPTVDISQIYGGGGNSGSTYTNDFIELYNYGSTAIDLTGWSVQYTSASGTSWQTTALGGSIAPGHYYLVQESKGTGGTTALPTPDATGTIAMSSSAGKVALSSSTTAFSGATPTGAALVDFVGFGSANASEGSPAPAPSNTTADIRTPSSQDTNNNAADFTTGAPDPRNSSVGGATGPTVSVGNASVAEGNSGTTTLNFTVTRTDTTTAFTVDYATADGTATTADNDYVATSGTLTFAAGGPATQTVSVTVNGDTKVEPDETVTLNLSNIQNTTGTTTIGTASGTGTIENDDFNLTPIYTIQGTGLTSSYAGQKVSTSGIVTALASDGYYIQDPTGDGNAATSDGLFVFTSAAPTGVAVGDAVDVSGTIQEYKESSASGALSQTELDSVTDTFVSSHNNALPAAVVIGTDGISPPTSDLAAGVAFYEQLEGMRVTVENPVAVGPTNSFGEIFTVASDGAEATGLNSRGELVETTGATPAFGSTDSDDGDFNPERIKIDSELVSGAVPSVNTGTQFNSVTGILNYDFDNFGVSATAPVTVSQASTLTPTVGTLTGDSTHLTFGSYNIENFSSTANIAGQGPAKVQAVANQILTNLNSPDIVALQEVQDDSGPTDDGTVSAATNLQNLVAAINAEGGAQYAFIDNPFIGNDTNGGEPGGNIRTAFLYRTDVPGLSFVQGSLATIAADGTAITDQGSASADAAADSDQQTDVASNPFYQSRPSLSAQFMFNGQAVTVVDNHFASKGGSGDLEGSVQPSFDGGEVQRAGQAQAVNTYVDSLLAANPNAKVIVTGDLNEFTGEEPLDVLEGTATISNYNVQGTDPIDATANYTPGGTAVLTDLESMLPADQQFDYNFQGNAESLVHTLVTNSLDTGAQFQPIHINSDFANQTSDHDPLLASFVIQAPQTTLALSPASDSGSSSTDGITNDNTPTLTGTTTPGATVTLFDTDGSTVLGTTTAASDGSFSITSSTLTDGQHSLTAAGGGTTSTAVPVTIDTAAPTVTFTSLGGSVNQASQTINGKVDTADAGRTVSIFEDGSTTTATTAVVGSNGQFSATLNLGANGQHTVTASVSDTAGNTGTTPAALTYALNTAAPTFTPGNLVISISGDGDGSDTYTDNQATPLVLQQITTSGAYVSQIVLPQTTTTVNGVTESAISAEYGSSSEGLLNLSSDGHSLVIGGYGVDAQTYNAGGAAVYGDARLAQSTSVQGGQFTPVARVVADVNANGTVDTSTAVFNIDNTNNIRSVATVDGSSFYISGQGKKGDTTQGLFLASDGASAATRIDGSTDTRVAEIYNGQLYVSRDSTQGTGGTSNISSYGATLPTGTTSGTILQNISQNTVLTAQSANTINSGSIGSAVNLDPEAFFFANADTLYVADGGIPKQGGVGDGGLQKWTYDGTKWTLDYTLSQGLSLAAAGASAETTGLIGLTGQVVGDTVQLYATNQTVGDTDQKYVFAIDDQLSATTNPGESFSTIVTAATDTNIRGIAFAPTPIVPTIALAHDTGTSSTDGVTNDPTLTTTKAVAADTLLYSVNGGAYSTTAPTFTTDGTYTVSVEEQDQGGQTGPAASLTFTLDTTADTGGDLAVHFGTGAASLSATPFTLAGLDPNTTATITFSGTDTSGAPKTTLATETANGSYTVDLSGFGSGPVTAAVSAADTAGNTATGTGDTLTVPDTTPPTLVSASPATNATDVAVGANVVLTFNEAVKAGTGNIVLQPATGSSVSIPVTSSQVTISGNTVTINPTADLRPGVAYNVTIGSGVITDTAGNAFAGIAQGALQFTSSFDIPTGSFAQTFTITDPGTFTLAAGGTRTQTSGTAVQATSTAASPTSLDIEGTLNDTAANARAIRDNVTNGQITVGAQGLVQSLNGDAIQAQSANGTLNVVNNGQIISGTSSTTVVPGGAGAPAAAYALNFNAALGASGAPATDYTSGGTITNGSASNTSALIRSDSGDAIRLGSHETLTNYGSIVGDGPVNDSSNNNSFNNTSTATPYDISRGVRVNQAGATSDKIENYGSIQGSQHGVDVGQTDVTGLIVDNYAGATITGLNGSGVGSDTTGAAVNTVTVNNFGTILGEYAPTYDRAGLPTVDGDGDGVDVDGAATVTNHAGGLIAGSGANGNLTGQGAGGYDSNGRANSSEGLSLGGGIVVNDGTISGANTGIVVNDDANPDNTRSGVAATSITNGATGSIIGQSGYAIRLENKTGTAADNDSIVNAGSITGNGSIPDPNGIVDREDGQPDPGVSGTLDGVTYTSAANAGNARFILGDGSAIQTGEGTDSLSNYGTITGNDGRAINMEGGNDALILHTGSTVSGLINGGAGNDTLTLALDDRDGSTDLGANSGVTTGTLADVIDFEALSVTGGSWTLSDAQAYSAGATIAAGASLAVGAAGALAADVADNGQLQFAQSSAATFSNVISGSGTVVESGAGTLTLSGSNSYSGGTTIAGGTLDVASASAAGTGTLTLGTGTQTLEISSAALDATTHAFANTIAGFGTDGDIVDLQGVGSVAAAILNSNTNVLTLTSAQGTTLAALQLSGSYAGDYFAVGGDGSGGTDVTVSTSPATSSGTVTASLAQFTANQAALDQAPGGFAIADTAAALSNASASTLSTLSQDGNLTAIVTTDGGQVTVGVNNYLSGRMALNKIGAGYALAAQVASDVSTNLDTIAFDYNAGHIKSVSVASGTVSASASQAVGTDKALLDALGTYTVSDTAANIAANINALQGDAGHIASLTASDNNLPSVGVDQFLADEPVLDKITGGYALAAQNGADLSSNIDAVAAEYNAGHLKAITVASGTVSVTAAQAINDKGALDAIGSYAVSDTAANIAANINALQGDASHIVSLTASDNKLPSVGVGQITTDRTVLDKITGGYALVAQKAANLSSSIDAVAAEYNAGNLKTITVVSGTVSVTAAQAVNDKGALDAIGSYAVTDTAANIAANIAALQSDAGHIASITASDGKLPGVGVNQFLADEPVLDKITGGFALAAGNATNVSTNIDAIAADFTAGHLKTITVANGTVTVTAAQAIRDEGALDAIGSYAISDTAANIAANINALEADAAHIASMTASDNTLPSVGVGQVTTDRTVLDKITGGYALTAQNATNLSNNLDAVAAEYNAGHLKAITLVSGTVTATAAQATGSDKALLDVLGSYAVRDTGAAISASINALQSDASHITSLTTTDGTFVSVGVGQASSDKAVLDKASGGFTVAAQNTTNLASSLDALQADVGHIHAITLAGSSPELSISAAQSTNDAGALAKITSTYALQVSNTDGSATTTANGPNLTIAPRAGGNETFVFKPAFGQDTITDFASHLTDNATAGTLHDTITLPSAEFANFSAVLSDATATSNGMGTIITAQNGDSLTLANVTTTQLQSAQNDFKFA